MIEPGRTVVVSGAAIAYLRAADPILAGLIDRIGRLEYRVEDDLWRAIVGSIVGQQLSVRAAATIRARLAALGSDGFPDPTTMLAVSEERLRACGLSRAKASYVQDAARAWLEGEVVPETLISASDERVVEELLKLRGVGRWTAQMVLIFCLERPDILAVDDLGIRAAVHRAYGFAERPERAEVLRIGEKWAPYRSVASLYLWRSLQF
jgi:3-methyladenine DNA glycosylase/8-oxoguanine DNA glycosylase